MIYWITTIGIFLTNLPFGYWRINTRRFSPGWVAAIHIPVLLIITFRIFSGIGFELFTFPLFIGAFFTGQFIGGKIYTWRKTHSKLPLSGCLVWDLVSECYANCFRSR